MEPLTYNVNEVAGLLGLSRSKTYELVASGAIPALAIPDGASSSPGPLSNASSRSRPAVPTRPPPPRTIRHDDYASDANQCASRDRSQRSHPNRVVLLTPPRQGERRRPRPGAADPVLSIAKLRVDAEAYYLELVASGVDEYYSERGEVPGRWVGTAVEGLGLGGQVGGEDLRAVLAGRDPRRATLASPRKVPGFDLTFSAPKSVSVLFALTEREVATRVVAAHDLAVTAALGYLEREACRVRRGHAGARQLAGDGFVAAAFRHRTSRAGDPQLHTHVLVANLARGSDGAWSALDARLLYRHLRTAGYLYQAQLRDGLTRQLGIVWGPVTRGSAEIAGIPKAVLQAFSRRRAEITEAMAQHGTTSRRGAQIAALATRQPKDHHTSASQLRGEWHRRASALGFDPTATLALVGRAPTRAIPSVDESELAHAATLETASFDRRDVLRTVAERAAAGATVEQLERRADRFLTGPSVVHLAEGLYTTPEMLRLEAAILTHAQRRTGAGLGLVPAEVRASVLRDRLGLSHEQTRMVDYLTASGHGVDVVLGVAGSGKTQALEAAHAAWRAAGHHTIGVALAARAAAELQARSNIPAGTLDALLHDLERHAGGLPGRSVVVLDEAGMVGTRKLARLLAHADAAHAKVVLVGDPRQLPEIEAGGAYAALARHLPAVTLTQNRRQRDPVDRQVLAELRRGDATAAIQRLRHHGRLTTTETPEAAREQMVADWHAARHAGHDTLMLAVRRGDVEKLNQLARHQLLATGQIQPDGITARGRNFSVGDRVMALSNRRYLNVVNGDRGTITAASEQRVEITLDRGPNVTLPGAYLHAGHLTHAYALTIHKAQGLTCDRALVLASRALHQEAGYTALSRGRIENRLYVPSGSHRTWTSGTASEEPETIPWSDRFGARVLPAQGARPRRPDGSASRTVGCGRAAHGWVSAFSDDRLGLTRCAIGAGHSRTCEFAARVQSASLRPSEWIRPDNVGLAFWLGSRSGRRLSGDRLLSSCSRSQSRHSAQRAAKSSAG